MSGSDLKALRAIRWAAAGLVLAGAAFAQTALQREPRPGDIVGTVTQEAARRPLDALETERRVTQAELLDLERRIGTLATTRDRRLARLRVRLRALYKLSQGGFGRLLLGAERPQDMYLWRNGARRIIGRDVEELRALREELRELDREQTARSEGSVQVARLEAEAARARAGLHEGRDRDLAGLGQLRGALPRPVSPGGVVSPFGREVVERGLELFRHGVELAAEPGGAVRVVASGQVRYTGEVAGMGQGVVVEHDGGYLTLYGRLDKTTVIAGDMVGAGTALGRAIYPRVYFQLALGDLPLDPEPWFGDRRHL